MSEKKVFDKSKINYYLDVEPSKFANWKVKFGKHKGKSFEELTEQEPTYCEWIVDNFDEKEPLRRFIESVA